jgi:hypothetical protein
MDDDLCQKCGLYHDEMTTENGNVCFLETELAYYKKQIINIKKRIALQKAKKPKKKKITLE